MIVSSDSLIEMPPNADYWQHEIRINYGGPYKLQYVRVYERVPVFPDDPLEVLRDALLAKKRQPEIYEIIQETGIAGIWLPSTILIRRIRNWYTATSLFDGGATVAHALWSHDFNADSGRGGGFTFELWNDCHFERQLRISLLLKDA